MGEQSVWSEANSKTYRQLAAIAVPARAEQMATLLTLIPFGRDEAFRVVELASGEGILAQAVLEAFPQATVLALDGEETMRQTTAARLSRFEGRGRIGAFDIRAGDWYPQLDGADCVLSSLCVHHLDGAEKQVLYLAAANRLAERGALLIADLVEGARREARDLFADTYDEVAKAQSEALTGSTALFEQLVATEWNYYRYPDPVDKPSTLFEQLTWLKEAGFAVVDCFWMQAGHAIYGGYRSDEASGEGERLHYEAALEIARRALAETAG